jgi:uncharacterized membrane protein YphA (DoxX/SURF4 family)
MKFMKVLKIVCMVVLSVTFLVSGFAKLLDPHAFVKDVMNYRLFPLQPLHILAIWLIMLEIFVAIGLWFPFLQRGSAWIIAGLMSFFIIIIVITMIRGLDITCGCFGPGSQKVGWQKIFENIGLLVLSLFLLWPQRNQNRSQV